MPKTFEEVYDLYNEMSNEGILPSDMSLKRFSTMANDITGTNEFSEGQGNWFGQQLRKGSYWVDKGIDWTGLPALSGDLMAKAFTSLGGTEETGRNVGEALPRGFVDFASFFVPGTNFTQAARLATAGLMSAFHTYGDTGSPLRAAVSGAMPWAAAKGGAMASNLLAKTPFVSPVVRSSAELMRGDAPTARLVTQAFFESGKDKALSYAASQVGAVGTMEAINYTQEAIANRTLNPYEGMTLNDWVLQATMGNLPYMLGDIRRIVKTPRIPVGPQIIVDKAERSPLPPMDTSAVTEVDGAKRVLGAKKALDSAKANGIVDEVQRGQELAKIDAMYNYSTRVLDGELPSRAFTLWGEDNTALKAAHDAVVEPPAGVFEPSRAFTLWTEELARVKETSPDTVTSEEVAVKTLAEADLVERASEAAKVPEAPRTLVHNDTIHWRDESGQWTRNENGKAVPPTESAETLNDLWAKQQAEVEATNAALRVDVKETVETTAEALVEMGSTPEEALAEATAGTKNAAVEEAKKSTRQVNVSKMEAFGELDALVRRGEASELEVAAYNEVLAAMRHPNANARKLVNAWFNWRQKPREGAVPLEDLKARLARSLMNEGLPKQLEANTWEKDEAGNNYAFRSKADAQETVNKLNAKLPKDAEFEYESYTNRSRNGPSKEEGLVVGVKKKFKSEEDRKANQFQKAQEDPVVKAEAKNAAEVVTKVEVKPEDKVAKKVAKDSLLRWLQENGREAGIGERELQNIARLLKEGKDAKAIEEQLAGMLAAKRSRDADRAFFDEEETFDEQQGFAEEGNSVLGQDTLSPARAGDGFRYRITEHLRQLPDGRWLFGGRLTLSPDGTVPRRSYDSVASRVVSMDEKAMWELAVPQAFEGDRVNLRLLQEELGKVPQVEVRELAFSGNVTEEAQRAAEVRHQLDTLYPGWYDVKPGELPREAFELYNELGRLRLSDPGPEAATGKYGVDPWERDILQGEKEISPGHKIIWSGDLTLNTPLDQNLPKFESQHYSSKAGLNQLAFVRGALHEYQPGTKLPNGETAKKVTRVYEVWEVQSDWIGNQENSVQTRIEANKEGLERAEQIVAETKAKKNRTPADEEILTRYERIVKLHQKALQDLKTQPKYDTPLLPHWESLAYKAALNKALADKADYIYLTDAETGMMTEKHDAYAERLYAENKTNRWVIEDHDGLVFYESFMTKEEADAFAKEQMVPGAKYDLVFTGENLPVVKQEKGMRAAYDERGPSILTKLTNTSSSRASMGKHSGKASPVFKEGPSNQPKTQNTGRLFDLSTLRANRALTDDFPLFGAKQPASKNTVLPVEQPLVPTTGDAITEVLRREGFTEREVGVFAPFLQGVVEKFNFPGTRMGVIVNDNPDVRLAGLADLRKNMFWLAVGEGGVPSFTKVRSHAVVIAHELGHVMDGLLQDGGVPKAVMKAYQQYKMWLETDTSRAVQFLDLWRSELPKEYATLPAWEGLFNADAVKDPGELYANSVAIWAAHQMNSGEGRLWQHLAPQPVREWANQISKYARKVLSGLNGARFIRKGEFTREFHETVDAVTEMFDVTVKAVREAKRDLTAMGAWATMGTQDVFFARTSEMKWNEETYGIDLPERFNADGSPAKAARHTATKEENLGSKTWDYFIRTTQALGAQNPVFRRLVTQLHNHAPAQRRMLNAMMAPLWGGLSHSTGAVTMSGEQATLARMLDARVNFKVNELVSETAQWWQRHHENESFNVQTLLKENPEWPPAGTKKRKLGDHYRVLNDKEKQAFAHGFKGIELGHREAAKAYVTAQLESGRNDMMLYMSKALAPDRWAQAPDLVRRLTDAMDNATSSDPGTQVAGGKALDAVRTMIGDDAVFQNALDMWADVQVGKAELEAHFASKPGHWSMIRGGEYLVRAYDAQGGERADTIGSLKDFDAWKSAARSAGFVRFAEPQKMQKGKPFSLGGDVLELVTQLENRRAQRIKGMGLDEDTQKLVLENLDVSGEVARILAAQDLSVTATMQGLVGGGRRRVPGNMDMMESQKLFFAISARMNAGRVMKSRVMYELTNPELNRFPSEIEAFKRHLDNYMRPDSDLSRAVLSFNAHYFLMGNLPAMGVNLLQAPFTVMPEIVNRGLNPFGATRLMAGAMKDMAGFTERLFREKVGLAEEGAAIDKMKNQDEKDYFAWLNREGYTTFGALNELTDVNADAAIDLNRITQTGAPFKPLEKAKSMVGNFAKSFMKAYAATEHYNMRLAALIGYRLAKQQLPNASKQEVYDFALNFMRDTTYAGGRANRPLAQGDHGVLGSMAYSLQSYTLGWLNQMARYISHWKGSEYVNLRPEERKQARNAAMLMFGAQVGAAGAMGLPFIGAFLKILENVTGVDYKGQLHQKMAEILDEDEKEGQGLANVILNGSSNALLAGSGVPIDLGSRWSFNNILGFNSYDGFAGDAVFGPTGGVVSSVLAGMKDLSAGELGGVAKAISPASLRKAVTLMLGDGEVRTREGGLVPLSDGEKIGYALGFTPQKLAALYKYRELERSRDMADTIQSRREATNLLQQVKDDPTLARQTLNDLALASNGTEDRQTIAKRVARMSADEVFPLDIRANMSKKSGAHLSQIAQMLGVSVPQAQVVARTQHMNNIMRLLGERPSRITSAQQAKDRLGGEISPFASAY